MNKEVKSKWIKALREYTSPTAFQDVYHSSLRAGGYFAPDGILCDLYLKEKGLSWDGPKCLGCTHAIPKEVKEWAGLDRVDPILPSYDKLGSNLRRYSLMTLNLVGAMGEYMDLLSGKYQSIGYKEIADLIEKDL